MNQPAVAYDLEILAAFKAKLLEERLGIKARQQKNNNPASIEEFRATIKTTEKESRFDLLNRHSNEEKKNIRDLADVEEALKRVEDGSYGVCPDCQTIIILERLWKYLTAKRCVVCQDKHEKEKNYH